MQKRIVTVDLEVTEQRTPPPGARWRFLGGMIEHKAGAANSVVNAYTAGAVITYIRLGWVQAAQVDGAYPCGAHVWAEGLAGVAALVINTDYPPLQDQAEFNHGFIIDFQGNTGERAHLLFMEEDEE